MLPDDFAASYDKKFYKACLVSVLLTRSNFFLTALALFFDSILLFKRLSMIIVSTPFDAKARNLIEIASWW